MSDPQGLAFARLAEDYDLGRPPWPPELLDGIDGDAVLDLAAGTGKLTKLLVERFAEVTAVEPLETMRAVLERNAPAAHVLAGSAERIPLDDRSVDAAFVAEAFHWFDSAVAVRELARVLRPGGALVVCFNHWESFDPQLTDEARTALRAVTKKLPTPGGPKLATGQWKRGFEDAPFAPFDEREHHHVWETTRESMVAYQVSVSSMGALPEEERLALRAELMQLLPDVPYRIELRAQEFRTLRT